jgi:hypothetical protein
MPRAIEIIEMNVAVKTVLLSVPTSWVTPMRPREPGRNVRGGPN